MFENQEKHDIKICLNMIVKNESHVITKCLNSLEHIIDAVAIADTGSSDNTVDIIEKWIKEKKLIGGVTNNEWTNFGENRTQALRYAESIVEKLDGTWYILFMDADDYVVGNDGKSKMSFDKTAINPDIRMYYLSMKCGSLTYDRTWMIKYEKSFKWKWFHPLHEYIGPEDGKTLEPQYLGKIKSGYILATREGARSQDPMKYMKDALTLELAKKNKYQKDKNSKLDPRDTFYLAQSYRDSGIPHLLKNAEKLYSERIKLGGWPEEIYIAMVEAGKCRERRGKSDFKALEYYLKAYELRPHRLEAPHFIVRWFRSHKCYKAGYTFGKPLINTPFPENDKLFVNAEIHNWRFLDEVAVCAYYSGDKNTCNDLCHRILKQNTHLDNINKKRILKNIKFCSNNVDNTK